MASAGALPFDAAAGNAARVITLPGSVPATPFLAARFGYDASRPSDAEHYSHYCSSGTRQALGRHSAMIAAAVL